MPQTINQMYLQLHMSGYNVIRVHTDRGGDFRGSLLENWCAVRSIVRSRTAGGSAQSNGWAERAIQEVKSRMQRALLQAQMTSEEWPLAGRYVHELERRWMGRELRHIATDSTIWGEGICEAKALGTEGPGANPRGGTLHRPRRSRTSHSQRQRESGYTSVFIGNTQKPDKEAWIALMTEQDEEAEAYARRRRLREKSSVKIRKMQEVELLEDENVITEETNEQIEEEQLERNSHMERIKTTLAQESQLMLKEDVETMGVTFDEIRRLKTAMTETAEDDVLRTRIISVPELMAEKEKWIEMV